MKPFQTLLLLAVLILIGGSAALYWGKTVQEAMAPIEVVVEPVIEQVKEPLAPGAYLVFQSNEWDFYRLAISDASFGQPSKFATLKNPLAVWGGLTTYVYGQHLLLHRYLDDEQDGIVSLDGEVLQTRPMRWGTIRSANGRYEVVWESVYDEVETDIVVTDLVSGEVAVSIPESVFDYDEGEFELEPFVVDDQGAYLYVHEVCACEATVAGVWRVDLATVEATRLDTLVDLDSWFLSSLDAQGGRLLSISTGREPSGDGPYDELLPPATIRILDLQTLESTDLLVDEERAWDQPRLDPEGNGRYVVRLWDEGNRWYLVDFEAEAITDEDYLTDGWVVDWVGDWLVVMNTDDSSLKLVNTQTREEVELELPDAYASYIGAIELN